MSTSAPTSTLALSPELCSEIVRRVQAATPATAVWLFGSQAFGAPSADSDIDLLLVLPDDHPPTLAHARSAHRALHGLRRAFDVVLTTSLDLQRERNLPGSLVHEVVTRGVQLSG